MTTAIVTHPACLKHETPPGHPECVERLTSVLTALKSDVPEPLDWYEAPMVSKETLSLVHPTAHIRTVESLIPKQGFSRVDQDTAVSTGSLEAALRAAGAVVNAVDEVISGAVDNAFCAIRPPGHHAEPEAAMGFCLFNNVAIGARHAQKTYGLERVAVVDFDVHHGNGTQACFWDHPSLFYASTHQVPHYPGTGQREETGVAGNIVNAPLAPGAGSNEFRQVMTTEILPALESFAPDFVLISAGFDAYQADPLADLNLVEDDFAWATRQLMVIADRHAAGRIVSSLEGGYHIAGLARCSVAHVRALTRGSKS